jgi:3'(2'), 5'-bisphosphate nucleotidase
VQARPSNRSDIVLGLRRLALDAGEAILRVYKQPLGEVRYKADASPVTLADVAATDVILAGMSSVLPGVQVVCEETESSDRPSTVGARFVLVDPLDGTKEFISRNGEFTVNIALIEDGVPVAGVVYAPAIRRLFCGWREPDGREHAFEEQEEAPRCAIRVAAPADAGLIVVASRSHMDARTVEYLKPLRVKAFTSAGSSLKFCMVATGEAHLYPRLGRTMEWDTAAGQAVLEAAGGSVSCLGEAGARLLYGKAGFENPDFVARGAAPRPSSDSKS